MITVGIDPGLSGAIGLIAWAPRPRVEVYDMPTFTVRVGKGDRRRLDVHAAARLLQTLALGAPALCAIEDLSGRPSTVRGRDGHVRVQAGQWEQGHNCGAVIAAAAACELPFRLIKPSVWKRQLDVPADKDSARRRASQLFPDHAQLWARVKDDGRAEAVLLAMWARQAIEGEACNS